MAEVVTKKIEAALDSPDERFVGVLVEAERGEHDDDAIPAIP